MYFLRTRAWVSVNDVASAGIDAPCGWTFSDSTTDPGSVIAAGSVCRIGSVVTTVSGGADGVLCDGPGRAFGAGDDPESEGPCGYTYNRASEGYNVNATVHLPVEIVATGLENFTGAAPPELVSPAGAGVIRVVRSEALNQG